MRRSEETFVKRGFCMVIVGLCACGSEGEGVTDTRGDEPFPEGS